MAKTIIWDDNEMRWITVWNGGDLVSQTAEQINDYSPIDTYKSKKHCMNEILVNDSEMSMRWNNEAW